MLRKTGSLAVVLIIGLIIWLPGRLGATTYGSGVYGQCAYGGEIDSNSLVFNISNPLVDMGNFSAITTSSSTAAFEVGLQCSEAGYIVNIYGGPPTNGAHTLSAMATSGASSAGTEQYGVNLVDNASPDIGANPAGGSGTAAANYNMADQFKYVEGDIIASAASSSDGTVYTISFIANASESTPAGLYTGAHTLICTATF